MDQGSCPCVSSQGTSNFYIYVCVHIRKARLLMCECNCGCIATVLCCWYPSQVGSHAILCGRSSRLLCEGWYWSTWWKNGLQGEEELTKGLVHMHTLTRCHACVSLSGVWDYRDSRHTESLLSGEHKNKQGAKIEVGIPILPHTHTHTHTHTPRSLRLWQHPQFLPLVVTLHWWNIMTSEWMNNRMDEGDIQQVLLNNPANVLLEELWWQCRMMFPIPVTEVYNLW